MARYQYAKNKQGKAIKAIDLVGQSIFNDFFCFGCGKLLIAKVNGKVKKPHFAHKNIQECNGETYLHCLGKQVFFETYNNCLKENDPFYIEFSIPKRCHKFKRVIRKYCGLGFTSRRYDLTNYYSKVKVEKKDNNFIPDILLLRESSPKETIYVEIAVTHFLSEKKESSGKRIIEIPINSEEDIDKIKNYHITENDALFLGFNQGIAVIPESECVCMKKQFFAFYVWDSGKSFLELTYLSDIETKIAKFKQRIVYYNLIETDLEFVNSSIQYGYSHGEFFISQVRLASQNKVPIKNCYLCKYSGENWSFDGNQPIYCKAKKTKCGSNQAAECDWYKVKSL
ncbi:hypothetical protein GCM10027155_12150 [Acinetobacter apis]|uniref:Competence protein CoiA-like family protein n=1 Tax=Acinetobacter apis TaxID=1229165 RepID=A0A217EG16_9GAMM|nr:competence protein CoiA family protein [Acinetobacter apis]SNQ29294.1 Competence protein CoiA-like family protein [Acinetobacter apis]